MAANFLCLTAGGGVPLFFRNKGNLKPMPYPVIGSLNGVHMFCGTHDVDLQTTTTDDSRIVWKVYHNSITLIIVTQLDSVSHCHLVQLLDRIFEAMVLVYGQDELINIKNVERFKREIKVCYKLVDRLLEFADSATFSDLTCAVDVLAAPENNNLQHCLDNFIETTNSPYGCLLVAGKVAVATRKWWELSGSELSLLAMLVSSLPPCVSRDLPVFLPHISPTVPHRLLTFQLIHNVQLCVICGPSPTLADLERDVEHFWRSSMDFLKSVVQVHPRNFPSSITLDRSIQGFLLVNVESHQCLCSVQPHSDDNKRQANSASKSLSLVRRREILRSFYKKVIGTVWVPPERENKTSEDSGTLGDLPERFDHRVLETYISSDTQKCYAVRAGPYQLFVLYNTGIPTYAMRSASRKTLDLILKDKNVCL